MEVDLHLPVAERRVRRQIRLPQHFQDVPPLPLPLLPPSDEISSLPASSLSVRITSDPTHISPSLPPIIPRLLRTFRTPRNIFGLFRQFHSEKLPSHDPEELIDLHDLSEQSQKPDELESLIAAGSSFTSAEHEHQSGNPLDPYPNRNSFLLGNWYWTHGVRGSQESFRELLNIVGNPEFSPSDIRHTRWRQINRNLGTNYFDEGDADGETWIDEDIGWKRSPINISVPFYSRTKNPGAKYYHVGHLYHRSLVSIIREKLANPQDDEHFHYEPFELFWRPNGTEPDVRVHGELYTSPTFVDAHRELQESPGEPGCNLPRVVVAMMFWSDETQLTNFSTAALWPCYLFFGNESKYRRCKPTRHLGNHVAYFEQVCRLYIALRLYLHCQLAPRRV